MLEIEKLSRIKNQKAVNKNVIQLIFMLICFQLRLTGQSLNCYCELRNRELLIGLDNPIQLINDKFEFVKIENISAKFIDYNSKDSSSIELINENGFFKINPTKQGAIVLHIQAKNCEVRRTLTTKPITATPRIGRFTSNESNKIPWAELQAYSGIVANVECCDVSGKCQVNGYEVFIIQSNLKVIKSFNIGEKFTDATIEIFKKSKSKDIILFRNIKYKCPGAEFEQRMPDMTLGIE